MSAVVSDVVPGSIPAAVDSAAATVDKATSPDAASRLAASRERLRQAMVVPPPPVRAARSTRSSGPTAPLVDRGLGLLRNLSNRVRALPAADVLIDAVETWWDAHPMHTAGAMAVEASKAYVQPVARRNPIAFVAGSAVVGALFFLTRPWRWALRPVLLAGLLPQIVSHALRRAPVGSWVDIATTFARRQRVAKGRRPVTVQPTQPLATASAPAFRHD